MGEFDDNALFVAHIEELQHRYDTALESAKLVECKALVDHEVADLALAASPSRMCYQAAASQFNLLPI
jgi:hypothetical protein